MENYADLAEYCQLTNSHKCNTSCDRTHKLPLREFCSQPDFCHRLYIISILAFLPPSCFFVFFIDLNGSGSAAATSYHFQIFVNSWRLIPSRALVSFAHIRFSYYTGSSMIVLMGDADHPTSLHICQIQCVLHNISLNTKFLFSALQNAIFFLTGLWAIYFS